MGIAEIIVDGSKITINYDDLNITDISSDMDKVAAQMAFWASVWASAESERMSVDAFYREWRASKGMSALQNEPKNSEWKINQIIESDSKFLKMKDALAKATRNVTLAKGMFEAYRIKANALQSKGAMMRSELDATGMSTKSKQKQEVADERVASMRKMFKGKYKKV